jgi:glycerol-3-phosphate dehydrogenase
LGLRLYDILGRRQRVMPGHRISRVPTNDRSLFRAAIRWTATFFDAWISHPEWLILELIGDACRDQPRSAAANYCRVMGCAGNILTLRDELTGALVRVTADTVVNATGAWLDRSAAVLGGAGPRVMGTKGSHLVLDHPALRDALDGRMAYFEAVDGRVCIVYPFLDRVLVGSTDIPVEDPDQIVTEPAEVDYLIDVLREVFPNMAFGRDNVVYTYVGVRPLARSDADKPGQISRDHSVVIDPPNATRDIPIVGLVGGKWTTFRSLAEEATTEVLQLLGRSRTASTELLPIGGGADLPADAAATERFIEKMTASGMGRTRALTLLARYGSKALPLAQRLAASGDVPLQHAPDYSAAELSYLCLETGVVHLDDLVIRRTLLAIRGLVTDAALAEISGIAAEALGWDAARAHKELSACATALRERHNVRLQAVAPDVAPSFNASLMAGSALGQS